MCSCNKGTSAAQTFSVAKEGSIIGSYPTLVEATAAATRHGGAVVPQPVSSPS